MHSWNLSKNSGAVDFRNRVVGARLVMKGINPYTFKWTRDYPDTLLDPSDPPSRAFSRITSPPPVLFLQSPFAEASYEVQRNINFALQWALFFFMLLAGCVVADSDISRSLVLFSGLALGCSNFWLFHLERGQQYVYMAALGMVSILCAYSKNPKQGLSGGALGLLASIRSPMLLSVVPAVFQRKLKFLAAFGVVYFLIMGLSTYKFGPELWHSYSKNVSDWIEGMTGSVARLPTLPLVTYPETVEGVSWMKNFIQLPGVGKKLTGVYTGLWIPPRISLVLTGLALLIFFGLLFLSRKEKSPLEYAVQTWAAVLIADYLLPTPRGSYNDALWFPLVFIVLSQWKSLVLRRQALLLLFVSILASVLAGYFGTFDRTIWWKRQLTKLILLPELSFMLFCFYVAYAKSLFKKSLIV